MPKNKFQEVIFTIIMVFFMVYAMICYNISLNIGGMSNEVFLSAFHELVIMGPIAFILDFFIVSKLAFMCAARMTDLCGICRIHVPADEPCCNNPVQKCRKSVRRSMASDNCYEFPNGILLAADLCRSDRTLYFQTYF